MRSLLFISIILNANLFLSAQPYSIKGQFWGSGESVEDQSDIKSQLGYIPIFSAYYELSQDRMIDLEWAYLFGRSYIGDSLQEHHEKAYRGWLRYLTQGIDARLGLQKVSFGPSRLLRPLAWFDTIDPEDPKDQTVGVEAFRLRVFPPNSLVLWSWIMKGKSDTLSYGGRAEISTHIGEWGFTFHQDPIKTSQLIGQYPYQVMIAGPHARVGVDYRYDGLLGFWFEGAGFIAEKQNKFNKIRYTLMTLGGDYTLPISTGLLIMSETLLSREWSNQEDASSNQNFSTFMASLSLGMFHKVILISNLDWNKNHTYNYLRWSTTFDSFSINCMVSINPQTIDNSFKLMFIYNH